jgi:glycogen(starch) synthase
MKVLHVLDHSLPLQSGYVYRTLGILRAQRGFGWQTRHLTSPRNNPSATPSETVDGWEFLRTPAPTQPGAKLPVLREIAEMVATAKRLRQAIATERPDIIHAHSPLLDALPAIRVGRAAGIPVVYEVRALWEDAAVDLGRSKEGDLRYRATRAADTYTLKRADGVVAICRGLRDEIASRGIPADRLAVVPNAVDNIPPLDADRGAGRQMRAQLGLDDKFVLGFIGSFYHYEGLVFLLQAMPELLKAVPNLHMLLVGGGPEDKKLRALAEDPALKPAVTFTGRVPHAQVPGYYQAVDLLICPRLKMRLTDLVTPLKPLESMAQGVAVLVSDVGGHRELVEHDRTGLMFQAQSVPSLVAEIARAAGSPALRQQLVATAYDHVRLERSWEACARPYQALYDRLLTAPR